MADTCRGCIYRSVNGAGRSCCDYLLITGKSRIVQGYTVGVMPGHRCPAYQVMTDEIAEQRQNEAAKKKRLQSVKQTAKQSIASAAGRRRDDLSRRAEARRAKMLDLYQAGKKDDEIAQAVGCSFRTVQKWRLARHLPSNNRKTAARMDDLSEKLAYLYNNGCNDYEIARVLSCSRAAVQRWRKTTNRPANLQPRKKGEKLTLNWKGAYELYQKGWNDVRIADSVGCSPRSVCSWRHANDLPPNNERRKA